jgi:hypothetical protein
MTRINGHLAHSMVSGACDPLAQFSTAPQRAPVDVRGAMRALAGSLLLLTGVAGAVWLAVLVHAVVFRPYTVGLLERIAPAEVEATTLTLPAGDFHLPPAVFTVVGYLVLVALASIVAKLATAMIKHGVSLLQPQAPESPEADDSSNDAASHPDPQRLESRA